MAALRKARRLVAGRPKNSLLSLVHVKGSKFNAEAVDELKKLSMFLKPFEKKRAAVGVEGIQRVIYFAVIRFSDVELPLFDTLEEAKEYLVKE